MPIPRCDKRLPALLTLVAVSLPLAMAHDDPAHERDRQPPYEGPGFGSEDGGAAPLAFPNTGIQLLAWMPVQLFNASNTSANTVEGYVSPSGREYAMIGLSHGTGFVDLSNPGAPRIIGFISGPTSSWRDLRTHLQFGYAVSEAGSGIQVFDLTNIDNDVVTLSGTVNTPGSASTHTVFVNNTSGFLYRCGGGSTLGLRIYSLANPAVPAYVGNALTTRYVHECQVVTYDSGPYANREIAFCFSDANSGGGSPGVDILDVTNKSNIFPMAPTVTYPNSQFCHQGWLTPDKQYVYVNDELDEQRNFSPMTTRIISVSDLANPQWVASFTNGSPSIDHNLYVVGNRIFESNYRSGLRIFDNSNPLSPTEIAYFDTYPENDNANFNGLWDNYPFLPSGIVLGSDIEKGLFVWFIGDPQVIFNFPNGTPTLLSPVGDTVRVELVPAAGVTIEPTSPRLHYRIGGTGAYTEVPLSPLSGNQYDAVFPPIACGSQVSYYFSARTSSNITWRSPSSAPTATYSAVAMASEVVGDSDDMEVDRGWTVGAAGDNATAGIWVRVNPNGTAAQPEDDHTPDPGVTCWVTGQGTVGGALGEADVDGGTTTLTSPRLNALGGDIPLVQYFRWYSNNTGSSPNNDSMPVQISNNDGATWTQLELVTENAGAWVGKSFRIDEFLPPTAQMRLRFVARDLGSGSVVEAAVDDVRIVFVNCLPVGDIDGDGDVDTADALALAETMLGMPAQPVYAQRSDLNRDGVADGDDLSLMIEALENGG